MQYKVIALFKKVFAAILSLLVSLSIITIPEETEKIESRPQDNTVTAYDDGETVADYRLTIDPESVTKDISDRLFGIFFEDINFAADGGLYAEKVINRSFEYGSLATDDELHGWSKVGGSELTVVTDDSTGCLNVNNQNYLIIENPAGTPAGVANRGFLEGMAVEAGEEYTVSFYAKALDGYRGKVYAEIVCGGESAAKGEIASIGESWQKYELKLTSSLTASSEVYLRVMIDGGRAALDMISMMPETYKGHGMRKDLAQKLEELSPAFLRFPGGCVIEGFDSETAYSWKDSIATGPDGLPLEFEGRYGDVAARPYGINIWTAMDVEEDPMPCYMSYGLGFYEYFQLAEDIGALGVPVLNCGLYCQMRGRGPVSMDSEEFARYLQDLPDLVEFCRGGADTTWGKVRVSLGHPEPFELQYICIGNENEGEDYYERYEAFLERFLEEKAKNPALYEGLELIYSAGAADATNSSNYIKSYINAKDYMDEHGLSVEEFAGATDQHYYNSPEWFLKHTDYYDEENYRRNADEMTDTPYGGGIGVFLGEYAARSNTLKAALAEAAYMTGLERNGDIVKMAAYAPLFGNLTATHWSPNLIWFNHHLSTGSVNYYVQKLFGNNVGDQLISSELEGAQIPQEDLKGMVGVGTWYTAAAFDNLKVTDNITGRTLAKENFTVDNRWWDWTEPTSGEWKISLGKLRQTDTWMSDNLKGAVTFYGNENWTNYTYTIDAKKVKGDEGFIIPFAVKDSDNYYFWNIGGWHNTVSCVQSVIDGGKSGQLPGTVKDFTVEKGRTYKLQIVVDGTKAKGYIDGVEYFNIDTASYCEAESYQVVSLDEETGDIIIKLVNTTGSSRVFAIDLGDSTTVDSVADVAQVAGDSLANDNILGAEEDCVMKEFTVSGFGSSFNYTVPMYSVTAIRLHTK